MADRGSAGMLFLSILLALGLLATGASSYLGAASRYYRDSEKTAAIRASLEAAARATAERLAWDASPESDSPRDAVWSTLGGREDGISLSLADASSGINPNFCSLELLESAEASLLFAPGSGPEDFAKRRKEKGLSTGLGPYAGIFAEEAGQSLSYFGWANANTADEDSLRALCLSLTASRASADAFALRIGAARRAGPLIGPGALESFLGADRPSIHPLIGVAASHNAHFASRTVIASILGLRRFGIADPGARADSLIAARDEHDLGEAEIARLCGTSSSPSSSRYLFQYLGLRTWFWRIRAEAYGHSYTLLVAAFPDDEVGAARPRRLAVVRAGFDS